MLCDPVDMSGSWLAVEEDGRLGGSNFSETRSPLRRWRNGQGRWRFSNSHAVQEASLYYPHPSPKSREGKGGIDETRRKA